MPRYRRVPTDRELRERALGALKQTRLFERMSVRLLADLIDKYGLTKIQPFPDGLAGIEPAVLVVLEGSVDLFMQGVTHWPPPPPIVGSPMTIAIPLSTGAYLRNLGPFRGIADWTHSFFRAAGVEPVRVFLLTLADFGNRLPQIFVNAMDPAVAQVVAS